MLGWLIRIFSVAGGVIAGWLVGRDAPNYSFLQMVVTLLLIVIAVAVLAFWPWHGKSQRPSASEADQESHRK